MRLIFVVDRYWPATGGVQTLMRHVGRELAERHEVMVVADRIDDGPDERLGESLRHPPPFTPFRDGAVRVVPLGLAMRHRVALSPVVAEVIPGLARYAYGPLRVPMAGLYATVVGPLIAKHARRCDVVHVWEASAFLAAAATRAARLVGSPIVMTPFVHPGQWGDDFASRWTLRHADFVVALLEADRAVVRSFGVRSDRTGVCGVCAPQIPIGGGPGLRRRESIDGPLVLFLGVRRPYKGHDLLLSVADRVAAFVPRVTFAFVGPGAALESHASKARIIDVGRVDEVERAGWLDAADLLCLPSRHEIFPVSVLEAWSTKTPVLVSDLPPLVEVVRQASGGWTVRREANALAVALVELLNDPEQRAQRGIAGHQFWQSHHTPGAAAACHERIYARAMKRPARGAYPREERRDRR
jgi:glycosyltransferase involved in cell wall biosynthesis